MSAILYAVEKGLVNDVAWSFHGLAVIWGTPAAGVNVDIMKAVIKCCDFVNIRDWTGEDAHASHLCFIGEADAADVILHSCDLSGAAGAVVVVGKDRFWERSVIVEVVGMLGVLGAMRSDSSAKGRETYKIAGEVLAFVVEAIVNDGCDDALTGDADFPETGDIHHVFGEFIVDDVPLLCKERICDAETGTNGGSGVGRNGRWGTFCSLAWELALEEIDGGEEAAGTVIAGMEGRVCAEGVVAGKDRMAMWRRVFWGAKEPCVGELTDLTNKLEAKAEFGDALVDGGCGGGGMVIEKEVVERRMVTLGGDGEGGDERGEEDEGEDEQVSTCHRSVAKGGDHVRLNGL